MKKPALRVALGVSVVLSVPLVAMHVTDEVVWTVWDFLVVGVLLAVIGIALELAVKKAGSPALAICVVALGVASGFFGMAGDAPGLVLIGIVLVASACALGVRTAQRHAP